VRAVAAPEKSQCPTCLGHKQLLFLHQGVANPEFPYAPYVNEASARLVAEQDKAVKGQRAVIRQRHRLRGSARSRVPLPAALGRLRACFFVYGLREPAVH
uniref:Transposase n=1 Tax=Macrostomum lignano TaxID=282301 RepID=A0A1I8FNF2_9PLAT